MNSEKAIANQTNDNLSFDERQVLETYRDNKEMGNSSLLLSSKSLPLLPYINSIKTSSKVVVDTGGLHINSAKFFLCYGYLEAPIYASIKEIDREVSKAADLGLLGFEQPSQPGKVCCITEVCIYKHKINRFNRRAPLVGLVHANLRLERLSNFGAFAYPFFREYGSEQWWSFLKPKCRIIINHISATDISLGDSCGWESKIDDSLIFKSYQRASQFSFFR